MPRCGCIRGVELIRGDGGSCDLKLQYEGDVNLIRGDVTRVVKHAKIARDVKFLAVPSADQSRLVKARLSGVSDFKAVEVFFSYFKGTIFVNLFPSYQHCYALAPYTLFDNGSCPRSETGELVHLAKYRRDEEAIDQLASQILELVDSHPVLSSCTAVTSPPSSDAKSPDLPLRWAKFIAREMNWRWLESFKTRETSPQKNLPDEIEEHGADLALMNSVSVPKVLGGDRVLVLDDTIGTGATLKEIGRAVVASNASLVCGLSAAKDARHTYGGLKLDKDAWP